MAANDTFSTHSSADMDVSHEIKKLAARVAALEKKFSALKKK